MSSVGKSTIDVVGGVYEERCLRPEWHEIFGSAGRAASAISRAVPRGECLIKLHCYVDESTHPVVAARSALEGYSLIATDVPRTCGFQYFHGLGRPHISRPSETYANLSVEAPIVLRFGMLEGDAVVTGERVVYDPQSSHDPALFHANGSVAEQLAIVVNEREALVMTNLCGVSGVELARAVRDLNHASVVVLKRGPLGAIVVCDDGEASVPAFTTSSVWKLGSGDVFSAHFTMRWALEGRPPIESSVLASKATARYCETRSFPSAVCVEQFEAIPITASQRFVDGYAPMVYLAGPFFTLAQLWLIEQARSNLQQFGLRVFSPYHDVGYGRAEDVVEADLIALRDSDIIFAIGDGLDSGTIFEVGYARARGTPVVVYSENEGREDLKMMEGSGCELSSDYVSAIYRTLWTAITL